MILDGGIETETICGRDSIFETLAAGINGYISFPAGISSRTDFGSTTTLAREHADKGLSPSCTLGR
jgi:hypothetical protein